MSKNKILNNTSSYHDNLIATLKIKSEAELYFKIALEEYQADNNAEVFLIALHNLLEAKNKN